MVAPAGISAQLGFKSETTYGTGVTPDLFHPGFLSESIKQEIARIESGGLRAGRRTTHQWKSGGTTIGGPVSLELWDEPLATLLTHMFGSVVTSGAGPYTHTATMGDLTGKSFTVQVGRPDIAGTVQPFTYAGCKLPSWSLACAVGEIAKLNLEVSAQTETTGTALASASYPTAAPFVFVEGSVSIAGSEIAVVESLQLDVSNALKVDRHRIGGSSVAQQLESGMREATGSFSADFEDLTAYNRYLAGTEVAVVMAFNNGTDSLTITTNSRFDGETPEVAGPEQLMQPLPFKCLGGVDDAAALTAVLVNGEEFAT